MSKKTPTFADHRHAIFILDFDGTADICAEQCIEKLVAQGLEKDQCMALQRKFINQIHDFGQDKMISIMNGSGRQTWLKDIGNWSVNNNGPCVETLDLLAKNEKWRYIQHYCGESNGKYPI